MANGSINLDHEVARKLLVSTLEKVKDQKFSPSSQYTSEIRDVILGSHLTFRYILITNLLAKSIHPGVHPLALQAKADLNGAFDSRSLCHKVFVPFEREQLGGKLGRSNEPYLNKPARFPALSAGNAVRKGYDLSILHKSIGILEKIKGVELAKIALADALYYTLQRQTDVAEVADVEGDATLHQMLYSFASKVIARSGEGETSAIVSGLAFSLYGKILKENFDIRVHPVNQAGSSSNETLDIDVYRNKELAYTAEVKDKNFTFSDVDHASNKVKMAGHDSFFFILGPQANPQGMSLEAMMGEIAKTNVKVTFVRIDNFYNTLLGFSPVDLDAKFAWDNVEKFMKDARIKDLSRSHIVDCAKSVGLIS